MIKKGQLFDVFFKRQLLTIAVSIVISSGFLLAAYRSYAKVAVFPSRLIADCEPGVVQTIEFILRNRTLSKVTVLGVSSDCGCFQTKTELPLEIESGQASSLRFSYSCPKVTGTNTISIMLDEKGTLNVLKVFVQHQ